MIKKFLFKVLDSTLGKILRLFQKMLLKANTSLSVVDLVRLNAKKEAVSFASQFMSDAMVFDNREKLWDFIISKQLEKDSESIKSDLGRTGQPETLVLEFGVWKGESLNYFAKKLPNAKLFGFDSFQGLSEDWYGGELVKYSYNQNLKMPKVLSNVKLIPGWFEETLGDFLESIPNQKISILHMDADTFTPTKYVLDKLKDRICAGTHIIFDEYFGYPGWKLHEFKAFENFVKENKIVFEYIGYSNYQVALLIK